MNYKIIKEVFTRFYSNSKREVNIAEYLNTYEERRKMMLTLKKIAIGFFIITYSYLIYDKIYQWYSIDKTETKEIKK
jgi:hypothetical protein